MADKKILTAVLVVLAIVLIAATAWYYTYRYGTTLVPSTADGGAVTLVCQAGQVAQVVAAAYTPPGASAVDVTSSLQSLLNSLSGTATLTVSGALLGQPAGGTLTFRYRCGSMGAKAGFRPVPISTCGSPRDDHYAVDMRGAAGTVVWDPYSTQSRVSLERYAETPEVAESFNPYTGVGKNSSVRAMSDRYRREEALNRLSAYELQPGEPGFMEEVGDGAMSLMAQVTRRSPPAAAGESSCLLAGADVDSDFLTDGYYGEAVLKEALTSRRRAQPNTLTASKTGLGSIRLDPRFEPGPPTRTPDGDASWAHGGHAGGPTSGAYASSTFMPGNTWDDTYIFAFGDDSTRGRRYPVEAMVTEHSTW